MRKLEKSLPPTEGKFHPWDIVLTVQLDCVSPPSVYVHGHLSRGLPKPWRARVPSYLSPAPELGLLPAGESVRNKCSVGKQGPHKQFLPVIAGRGQHGVEMLSWHLPFCFRVLEGRRHVAPCTQGSCVSCNPWRPRSQRNSLGRAGVPGFEQCLCL